MPCTEALRTQEYFDGELDASASVEVERHLETCADCAMLLADLEATRTLIREQAPYHRADDALRKRIADSLRREDGDRPRVPWFVVGNWRFLSGAGERGPRQPPWRRPWLVFAVLPPPSQSARGGCDERPSAINDVGSPGRRGVERPPHG